MITSDKYFIEVQLEFVLETNIADKAGLIKKINNAIDKLIKDQSVIHFSSNINSVSEDELIAAYVSGDSEVN